MEGNVIARVIDQYRIILTGEFLVISFLVKRITYTLKLRKIDDIGILEPVSNRRQVLDSYFCISIFSVPSYEKSDMTYKEKIAIRGSFYTQQKLIHMGLKTENFRYPRRYGNWRFWVKLPPKTAKLPPKTAILLFLDIKTGPFPFRCIPEPNPFSYRHPHMALFSKTFYSGLCISYVDMYISVQR